MSKREVDFELDFGLEATLVYYVVDYPEGRSLDIDWIYYTDKVGFVTYINALGRKWNCSKCKF